MLKRFVWVGGLALLAAVPGMSQVRQSDDVHASSAGSGRVSLGTDRGENLSQAHLTLRKGGSAEVSLTGNRTWRLTGTWSGGARDRMALQITRVDGESAEVTGWVELSSRADLGPIDLNGTVGRRRFDADFRPDQTARRGNRGNPKPDWLHDRGVRGTPRRDDRDSRDASRWIDNEYRGNRTVQGGQRSGFGALNTERDGHGSLDVGKRVHEAIVGATVHLREGGEFDISIKAKQTRTFSGRWRGGQGTTVELDFRQAFGGSTATGQGTLTLEKLGGRMERLEFQGNARRESFAVRFAAD